MAKKIKDIHERVRRALKKGITGYVSPEDIDVEVHTESLNLWKKYLDEFERTHKINMFFRPFVKTLTLQSTNMSGTASEASIQLQGNSNDPVNDYHKYHVDCRTSAGNSVDVLTLGEYRHRFNHPYKGPSTDFPIAKFEGQSFFIAPKIDCVLTLIHKPVKSKYAYTPVSSTKIQYNDTNSIDIEWDETLHDDIVNRVIENISISMRESSLLQYTQLQKAQEGK